MVTPGGRVALGCGNFGGVGSAPEFFGQGLSRDQAFELMDAAWELGITHFDTADAYGGGRSETAIGAWIRSRGAAPQLTTKTYNPMLAGADFGLKPERIARQLRGSLERLGVDRVDLYLAHEFDPDVPLPESIGAFEAARRRGPDRRLRGQQLRRRAACRGHCCRSAAGDPELLLPADAPGSTGGPSAVRRASGGLPSLQSAGWRLADRQVPAAARRSRPGRG